MDDDQVRVYVAAGHTAADEARRVAAKLEDIGAVIVSKWFSARPVFGEESAVAQVYTGDDADERNAEAAKADVDELTEANVFVGIYNADSRASHAEFGIAFAGGIPCLVTSVPQVERPGMSGESTPDAYLNMLHFHPSVGRFGSTDAIVAAIKPLIRAKQITCEVCFKRMKRSQDRPDLFICWCGATRERPSFIWREEAVVEHLKSGCPATPLNEEDRVFCSTCEFDRRSQ